MDRLLVALDPGLGISAAQFTAAWARDVEASGLGSAHLEPAAGKVMFPGVVEWVVLPLAVNLLSSVMYDVVKRLASCGSPGNATGNGRRGEVSEVEVVEFVSGSGDRVLVVRSRRTTS